MKNLTLSTILLFLLSISTLSAETTCDEMIGSWLCANDITVYTFDHENAENFVQVAFNSSLDTSVKQNYICKNKVLSPDLDDSDIKEMLPYLKPKERKAFLKNPGAYQMVGKDKMQYNGYDPFASKMLKYECKRK